MRYFKLSYGLGADVEEEYGEFSSYEEAEETARQWAYEEYESYAGLHGYPDLRECAEELWETEFSDEEWEEKKFTEEEESELWGFYTETIENIVNYEAIEVEPSYEDLYPGV